MGAWTVILGALGNNKNYLKTFFPFCSKEKITLSGGKIPSIRITHCYFTTDFIIRVVTHNGRKSLLKT